MKAAVLSVLLGLAAAAELGPIPGSYIVQLKPGASAAAHHRAVRGLLRKRDGSTAIAETFRVGDSFDAYSTEALTEDAAAELAARDDVLAVEQDYVFAVGQDEPRVELPESGSAAAKRALTTQSPAGFWGLGDVSHIAAGQPNYVYDSSAGEGQTVYVLDTGIRISHSEFEGRARFGFSAITGSTEYDADDDGHGTHVAGTVAGKTYGVAKKANVVAVRVVGLNQGQLSWVLRGLEWSVNDIKARNATATSVLNLSLSAHATSALDNAVRAVWEQGIVTCTAAGNNDGAAAEWSPARIAETITVGMTQKDRARVSIIANVYGSNWGPELDLFAPGRDVVSASYLSDSGTASQTGTSMATPFVAGLIAYLRGLEGGLADPEAVRARLLALAQKGVVGNLRGSPNVLVYNGSGR